MEHDSRYEAGPKEAVQVSTSRAMQGRDTEYRTKDKEVQNHGLITGADDFAWFKADMTPRSNFWPEYPALSSPGLEDTTTNVELPEEDEVNANASIQYLGAFTSTSQLCWLNQQSQNLALGLALSMSETLLLNPWEETPLVPNLDRPSARGTNPELPTVYQSQPAGK